MTNPLVTLEKGPCPAGKSDQCVYCQQKIGQPHKDDCPFVTKFVNVRMSFNLTIEVPRHWDNAMVEYQYGEDSSWCFCLSNLAGLVKDHLSIQGLDADDDCLCEGAHCEVIEQLEGKP